MFKKVFLLLFILSASLFFVVGCGDDDKPTTPTPVNEFNLLAETGDAYFSTYTTPSGASVNIAIAAVFDNLMDGNTANDPFIIDYRAAAEYNACHIQGAVNWTLAELMTKVDAGAVPSDKTILNVCYTGQTASAATMVLNLLGFEAQNLLFGMCAVDTTILGGDKWALQIADDERTLVSEASTTTATHEFPTFDTGKETVAEIIKARFAEKITALPSIDANLVWDNPTNYFIINYWPAAEYTNPGHIPGAYQFTPNTSLLSDAQLNLLPTDKTIVVYCYTGQTSAQVASYLKMLGYDAKSLLFGVNGFAYNSLSKSKYVAPVAGTYDAILVKP